MKRKKVWIGAACLAVLLCAGAFAAFIYIKGQAEEHFAKGTILNGVDVSGMTLEELDKRIGQYSIDVVQKDRDGESFSETILGNEFNIGIGQNEDAAKKVLREQGILQYLLGKGTEHTVENWVEYDEKKLEDAIRRLSCFDTSKTAEPEDAHISKYNKAEGCYRIIAESDGNTLEEGEAFDVIMKAVHQMEPEVNLLEEGCYKMAAVASDDKALAELLEELNAYVGTKITYHFGTKKEVVDGKLISKWIKVNKKNQVVFKKEKISEFVASLRRKYDTIFRSRKFKTSYGKKITVEGGDYGWWMDTEQENIELTEMIKKGESGERTPVYRQTAASYDTPDYGDTYVEINLTAQHLFLYKDGQKILESDFVSGSVIRGYSTPGGIYGLTYKQRDATLTGETYRTPVSFWMPFNNNIGMHDATWRKQFGGNIYITNGSHGCINLPYSAAKEIYGYIEKGTPVICYYLPGTESVPEVMLPEDPNNQEAAAPEEAVPEPAPEEVIPEPVPQEAVPDENPQEPVPQE